MDHGVVVQTMLIEIENKCASLCIRNPPATVIATILIIQTTFV